MSYQVVERQL